MNQIDKDEYAYFDRFTRGFVQPGLQGRTSEERRRRRSRSASEKILFQIFSSMLEERPALLKKHPLLRNPQSVKQMVAAIGTIQTRSTGVL